MSMSFKLDTSKMRQMQADRSGRDAWLRGVGNQMVGDIVLSFGTSPPGKQYGNHVASEGGYPPNVDTNALRGSIKLKRKGVLHYQIVDGVEYGIYLEKGTEGIEARPFVLPVFLEWEKKIEIEAKDGLIE